MTLECVQKGHQVGSFLVRENKPQVRLVVAHHVIERRGDTVVEIWRARGEGAQRRRLEATQIIPKPCDLAPARIGQLANFARRSIAEGVEGQVRSARLG